MHDFRLQGVHLLEVNLFAGFAEVGRQGLNQCAFMGQHSVPQLLKLVAAFGGCGDRAQLGLLAVEEVLQMFHRGCQK